MIIAGRSARPRSLSANTTVAAVIISNTALAAMPGNVFLPATTSGLPKDSVVNVTALVTLDKTNLEAPTGHLPTSLDERRRPWTPPRTRALAATPPPQRQMRMASDLHRLGNEVLTIGLADTMRPWWLTWKCGRNASQIDGRYARWCRRLSPLSRSWLTSSNALRASAGWRPSLSLVAEEHGAVAGHVLASRGWLDARARLVNVLVLSPLSVTPGRQGQGIGTRLVRRLLAAAASGTEPAIFLEGSPGYYRRFGFEPAGPAFRRPSLRIPESAFQVLTFASCKPWMTGTLVYPEAFWELDCVGLR